MVANSSYDPQHDGASTCAERCPKGWLRRDCHRTEDCLAGFRCCRHHGNNGTEQRCYQDCPEESMSHVCHDDADCKGLKLTTADLDRRFQPSPPKVDALCLRNAAPDWFPIPAGICIPNDAP